MKTFYQQSVNKLSQLLHFQWLLITCLFLAALAPPTQVQAQEVMWDRTYGGNSTDAFRSVLETKDGNLLLGGLSISGISGDKTQSSQGSYDYWVLKIDKDGNKIWDKSYGSKSADYLLSLQYSKVGGYLLGGYTSKSEGSQNDNDFWVVKIDENGNKLWDITSGLYDTDFLYTFQQTSDGGYILGGYSFYSESGDQSQGDSQYWVMKLDANGNQMWYKKFGGKSPETFGNIQQTNDGGYFLVGESASDISSDKSESPRGGYDYWILKLDTDGNKEWDKTFGGISDEYDVTAIQTKDGGYIVGGSSESGIGGDKTETLRGGADYWVIKLDMNGNKEWDKTIGGNDYDYLSSIQQTSDGGYVLGGNTYSRKSGDKSEDARSYDFDYWIVMLSASGNIEWDKTIGGDGRDIHVLTIQTNDGSFISGGSSKSGISGDKTEDSKGGVDYWIVKLGPEEPCTPPTPSIAVVPTSKVYTGGNASTIYLGYGPQSVQLVASGGTTYSWSPSTGLSSTTAADPVFTPTSAGTYTFTVTAYNGTCSKTASVTITVVDARCGNGKVMLCHKGKVICISPSAVAAHLRNHSEDRLGSCSYNSLTKGKSKEAKAALSLTVYPNPLHNKANVELSLPKDSPYLLELHSANGKKVSVVGEGKARAGELVSLELKAEKLREGIYYLRLTTADEVKTLRLVLKK